MNNDTTANVRIVATDETKDAVESSKSGFTGLWKSVAGGVIAAQAVQEAWEGLKEGFDTVKEAAEQWQTQQSQLTAAIASTHDVSGVTKQDADEYAESISKSTPITRDATLAAENMLLTFTGIHKDVFPQTTQAVADMATRMSGGAVPSLQQMNDTAIMVGKALNDPEVGLTKLQRVGVTFTDQQKEQIKTMQDAGNVTGAQTIILNELSKEFGGSAAANAETFSGRVTMVKNSLIDFGVDAVPKVESALNNMASAFIKFTQSAEFKQVLDDVGKSLESIWSTIQNDLVPELEALWKAINPGVTEAFKLWAELMGVELAVAWQVLVAAIKIFIDAIAIVAMIIVDATHFFEEHKVALIGLMGALSAVAAMIIVTVVPAMIAAVIGFGSMAVAAVAAAIATAAAWVVAAAPFLAIIAVVALVAMAAYEVVSHWSTVKQWFGDFVNWFKSNWQLLAAVILLPLAPGILAWHFFHDQITGFISDVVGFITGHWQLLLEILTGPIGWIVGAWLNFHNQIIGFFGDMVNAIASVWGRIIGVAANVISGVWNTIRNGVSGFGSLLLNAGSDLVSGLVNGINNAAQRVFDAVKGIGSKAVSALKGVLKIFSPSQVFADLGENVGQGFIQGIQGTELKVGAASASLGQASVAAVQPVVNAPGSSNISNTSNVSNTQVAGGRSTVTIQQVVLSTPAAAKQFIDSLNQDSLNVSRGLSVVQGAY